MKKCVLSKIPLIVTLLVVTLIVLSVAPFHYPSVARDPPLAKGSPSSSQPSEPKAAEEKEEEVIKIEDDEDKCDVFTGEWVPNPKAPYYTNTSCWAIHEHQNCMKYGKPDTGYMNWRWKPDGCDLPIFNPYQFLDIVRGKSMAIVGDSLGRNQLQSMICLLSRVEYPADVSYTTDENFKRWKYLSYNFTLAFFNSPFLVKTEEGDNGLFNLYLDEFDEKWTAQIHEFEYVIINSGHWFTRRGVYYENRQIVGCRYCQLENIVDLPGIFGYRKAFRTAFRALNSLKGYKGITFLRTFAPTHFENGEWDNGGDCPRTKPFKNNEISLEGYDFELYMTQVEEFRAAEREGKKKGLRFRLLDTTQAMLMRPDGHPGKYGYRPPQGNQTIHQNDCTIWCLPGPIDSWSDFLLHMLKMEGKRSHEEMLQLRKIN